jgi:hypothetical protein
MELWISWLDRCKAFLRLAGVKDSSRRQKYHSILIVSFTGCCIHQTREQSNGMKVRGVAGGGWKKIEIGDPARRTHVEIVRKFNESTHSNSRASLVLGGLNTIIVSFTCHSFVSSHLSISKEIFLVRSQTN